MCFSATASFATSAILLPAGLYNLQQCKALDSRYRSIAAFPLLFGIQQALEGKVWLELESGLTAITSLATLGFLFFVLVVWPVLVPLSAWQVEQQQVLKRLFAGLTGLGVLFGAVLFIPLLMNEDLFAASSVQHSVYYQVDSVFSGHVPDTAVTAVYSVLVILPLLLSSTPTMRRFGVSVLASFVITLLMYRYAFVSVWCFFAALLSAQLLFMLRQLGPAAASSRDGLVEH